VVVEASYAKALALAKERATLQVPFIRRQMAIFGVAGRNRHGFGGGAGNQPLLLFAPVALGQPTASRKAESSSEASTRPDGIVPGGPFSLQVGPSASKQFDTERSE
jgi:hypothetical protein